MCIYHLKMIKISVLKSEKDSRDELTDMLKSSLKAVQDHLE